MFTTTLAAIATFQVVFFSKHDITLFSFVKILRVQFLFEHLLFVGPAKVGTIASCT